MKKKDKAIKKRLLDLKNKYMPIDLNKLRPELADVKYNSELDDLVSDDVLFALNNQPVINTTLKLEDPWIQTYTGKRFTPTNPVLEDIDIEDIAHALSNICRFTGHSENFYSVAQHCVLVSYICQHHNALQGLLHDASEAYCQDIASPLKRTAQLSGYREVEAKLQNAIANKFNISEIEPDDVKVADLKVLATEARDLLVHQRSDWDVGHDPLPFIIQAFSPKEAKQLFLNRFWELTAKRVVDVR
jgi:5'-deoxynucleotidase YfbR-like HD superfamily hydrolase